MNIQEQITAFLSAKAFGVAGASANRDKYGNKVLRCYQQKGRKAYPINMNEVQIEGADCVASIDALPPEVESLSMITPPQVTLKLVEAAIKHGIKNIWMQPGAEHPEAIALCRQNDINIIADGSCILVVLGYHEH